MANPNIVNVSDIRGNTSSFAITSNATPFATAVANNLAGSNKVYKINTIVVANKHGTLASPVSVLLFSEDDLGGSNTEIISTVSVPADGSLVAVDKNTSFYLLEDKSIGISANTANVLVVTASWEEIS
jgi:hypothetical protein